MKLKIRKDEGNANLFEHCRAGVFSAKPEGTIFLGMRVCAAV